MIALISGKHRANLLHEYLRYAFRKACKESNEFASWADPTATTVKDQLKGRQRKNFSRQIILVMLSLCGVKWHGKFQIWRMEALVNLLAYTMTIILLYWCKTVWRNAVDVSFSPGIWKTKYVVAMTCPVKSTRWGCKLTGSTHHQEVWEEGLLVKLAWLYFKGSYDYDHLAFIDTIHHFKINLSFHSFCPCSKEQEAWINARELWWHRRIP